MPIDREKATLSLDEPVSRVRLVSPARAAALEKLGVRTLRDLLTHFPRSYIDLSQVETCGTARIGEVCTIRGTVHEIKLKKPRYNLKLVEIALVDGTGILMVTCFRQPWLMDQVKAGDAVAVSGKVTFDYGYEGVAPESVTVVDGKAVTSRTTRSARATSLRVGRSTARSTTSLLPLQVTSRSWRSGRRPEAPIRTTPRSPALEPPSPPSLVRAFPARATLRS